MQTASFLYVEIHSFKTQPAINLLLLLLWLFSAPAIDILYVIIVPLYQIMKIGAE